jgi:hypothetical protein
MNQRIGTYLQQNIVGESYKAFIPLHETYANLPMLFISQFCPT